MSEIEFTDPIFCQDLATSECQSFDGNRQENIFRSSLFNEDQSIPDQSNNIFEHTYCRKNRMSQTTATRRTPIIRNSNHNPTDLQSCKATNIMENRYSKDYRQPNHPNLQQISETEQFECQGCRENPNRKCQICRGSKTINGNSNLIKFMEYVISFKMGMKTSYKEKKLTNYGRLSVNNFCNDFFNSRDTQVNVRQTYSNSRDRQSFGSKKCDQKQIIDELNTLVAVHQNYVCDVCQTTPIVGTRFHCPECKDYDECGDCNKRQNHGHIMQKIQCCGKKKQLEGMMNLLSQSQAPARISLRPPPSIKRELDALMVTRSALH